MLWCTSISCSQLLLCVLLWHSAITLTCHKPESKQMIGDYYRQWKIFVAQIIQNHCLYMETAIGINRFNANHSYWHACMRASKISVKNVANFVGHIKTWNFLREKPSRFVSRSCTGVLLGMLRVNKYLVIHLQNIVHSFSKDSLLMLRSHTFTYCKSIEYIYIIVTERLCPYLPEGMVYSVRWLSQENTPYWDSDDPNMW